MREDRMAMVRQDSNVSVSSLIRREKLYELPFYFPDFSNTREVAKYIKRKARGLEVQSGCFLVRPSFSDPQCQTVSVLVPDGSVRHAKVLMEIIDNQLSFYLVPEIKFYSLQSLLDYYAENTVHNLEGVEEVKFQHALLRENAMFDNGMRNQNGSLQDIRGFPNQSGSPQSNSGQYFQESPTTLIRHAQDAASTFNYIGGGDSGSSFSMEPVETISPLTAKEEQPKKQKRDKNKTRSLHNTANQVSRPPLPVRPNLQRPYSESQSINSETSEDNSIFKSLTLPRTNFSSNDPLDNRPPAPLPDGGCAKSSASEPYYSRPRDPDIDMTENLKHALKMSDICECGLPRELSDLPAGWTIHRSRDGLTLNKGFFQSPSGQTAWHLPSEIHRKLTPIQKANLRKLDLMFGPSFIPSEIWPEPQLQLMRPGRSESNLTRRGPSHVSPQLLNRSTDQLNITHF